MPGGDAYILKYQSGHSKRQKKQKQNEEAKRNQGSLLGFLKPRDNDHPISSTLHILVSIATEVVETVREPTETVSSGKEPIRNTMVCSSRCREGAGIKLQSNTKLC